MTEKIREAAADMLDAASDIGRWVAAAALMGGATIIVVRAIIAP